VIKRRRGWCLALRVAVVVFVPDTFWLLWVRLLAGAGLFSAPLQSRLGFVRLLAGAGLFSAPSQSRLGFVRLLAGAGLFSAPLQSRLGFVRLLAGAGLFFRRGSLTVAARFLSLVCWWDDNVGRWL
jgi:hypothetical protein